jgi:nucleoporin GLE1
VIDSDHESRSRDIKMAKGRSPVARTLASQASPRNRYNDSPSRQLHLDLEQTIAQLQLYDTERQKLHVYQRKSVQDELDARELAQAVAHKSEIEHAIAKHEIVRQQAVAVLEAHIKEEEERKRQQEEEERRQREEEARQKAEELRRINEERERKAKEAKEKAEAAKRAAERRAQAERDEKQRKEAEAAAEKQRLDQQKAQAEAEAAKQQQSTPSAVPGDEPAWSSNHETRHRQYLDIHRRLKTFRSEFWATAKKTPHLKDRIGDMRRAVKTSVNQLTTDNKELNKQAVSLFPIFPRPMLMNADDKSEKCHLGCAEKHRITTAKGQRLPPCSPGTLR